MKYGKHYWCVKTNLSKNGEIYLMADRVEITQRGELLFWRDGDSPAVNLAISLGNWKAYFPASMMDGSAVAVEHWAGEIASEDEGGDEPTSDPVSPEDRILRIVAKKGLVTIREITQQTKTVDSQQVKPIVAQMVAAGLLIEVESGRTYRYALPE